MFWVSGGREPSPGPANQVNPGVLVPSTANGGSISPTSEEVKDTQQNHEHPSVSWSAELCEELLQYYLRFCLILLGTFLLVIVSLSLLNQEGQLGYKRHKTFTFILIPCPILF